MAASFRTSAAGGGTTGTSNRTVTYTPAVGDLPIVFCNVSANTNTSPTCTDNNGSGTYTLIRTQTFSSTVPTSYTISAFVRDTEINNTTSTVITVNTGSNTSGSIVVIAIQGMTRVSANAILQSAGDSNGAAGGTPAPVFGAAVNTNNLTIGMVGNWNNPATMTAPTNWTEQQDVGQNSPTVGVEVVTRTNGFTGTTITWGSTSSVAFADIALELDGSNVQTLTASMSTFSGAITKQGIKALPASMSTFSGTLTKLTSHILTSSMSTFAAVLAASKLKVQAFTASMSTFAGALAKQTNKSLSASMSTFAATITKLTAKVLASAMSTFSAVLVASHLFSKALTASMSTFSGAITKQTQKALTAGMSTFAGALVRKTLKSLAAGMSTFAGAVSKQTLHGLSAAMATFSGLLTTGFISGGGGPPPVVTHIQSALAWLNNRLNPTGFNQQ